MTRYLQLIARHLTLVEPLPSLPPVRSPSPDTPVRGDQGIIHRPPLPWLCAGDVHWPDKGHGTGSRARTLGAYIVDYPLHGCTCTWAF